MIILELRELAMVLDRKVTALQREFTRLADRLVVLRRKWTEEEETERPKILKEQETLKEKQLLLAEQVNIWRDRLRAIENPSGEKALLASLEESLACGDAEVVAAVQRAKQLLEMDPEEKAALFNQTVSAASNTPVGRLIQRAKTSYDLRNGGPVTRQEVAVEFANRSGVAQEDSILSELEAAAQDSDPVVSDVCLRTLVQILRFRAVRAAELDTVHAAVVKLTKIRNSVVVPVLIEIMKNPRQGYLMVDGSLQEQSNGPSRLQALIALVEFRTKEAQTAIRTRRFDKDPSVANAAERALQAFPGEWGENPE
ncbi:MAG: hypothetical protein JW929_09390 [Anaerolineales bacterium]|nr:hypothetical protein [Anaerolineales bacterium]